MLVTGLIAYATQNNTYAQTHSDRNQNSNDMKSLISIFEIPATDLSRAVAFYQSILNVKIETIDMQGTQMGLLPSEDQTISGVITKGEGYEPSANGVMIYLNGGDNLQHMLDKVEKSGGSVIVPKTLIDEETGYFALFLDTEGNRIGLHSRN
ncbi:Glyoxalase family protein [Fulvivirga imtechensis AK7]|uniref:Glyoxalase family protein n=2 Tax=Fulvivirga TaxID=396811 RepID=L8JXX1_9BACT|nr:Glyoxalase family protein [Fulvivirga imtechensis AK7]